jgi:signal peptidase I
MSAAVLDLRIAKPAPALGLVPAAARLIVKAVFGVVLLGLLTLVAGPRLYPFQSFYVRTGSMAPVLPVGALVIATRAPAEDLGPGDVIVFERPDRPGMMVVHRIEAVEQTPAGPAFLTKGDANAGPDEWRVAATGDGWRVVYSMDRAGFTVGWLHTALTQRGWLATVAIFAAVYALLIIWRSDEP